jgi:hypothetical protein
MYMQPYSVIFPEKSEPVMALQLDRKTGKIPKGTYGFIEFYCTDKGCDCRRTTLFVLNTKMQEKAIISMGFDPDDDMAGPFLDELHEQSPFAGQLLDIFVDLVNETPDFVEALQRHYQEVRTNVEGKKYRGKAFPKPGTFPRRATEPPDMPDSGDFLDLLKAAVESGPINTPRSKKRKENSPFPSGIQLFAERYYTARNQSRFDVHHAIQDDLRHYILDHETFAMEISSLLVEQFRNDATEDDRLNATLRTVFDILEILRVELERERTDSHENMVRLQNTLAQKIYVECGDTNLCAAVSHVLLQSRVELLPVLHDANSQRLLLDAHSNGLREAPPDKSLEGLFNSIDNMGVSSPFEALENLLQMFALGDPEMQTALCGEMLNAKSALVRDAAALMILHPMPDVRMGVSRLLAENSTQISPHTLRRLIITRNWFPENIRTNIDLAVSRARRARIDCAPLPKIPATATIYASPVDGAFAQSFQIVVPCGKGHVSCAILLKKGTGVADAFIIPLPTKKELNNFRNVMKQEGSFSESSSEYLDQRVCHALAEGVNLGKVPNFWLANIAEVLGKDQWKGITCDVPRELASMRSDLERTAPALLSDAVRSKALKESGAWHREHLFVGSWFEDDAEVNSVIEKSLRKSRAKSPDRWAAIDAIIDSILEKRRHIWLERLTLNALWLKSSRKHPLPWHQLLHLAEAVANNKIALADIPLMESVAMQSLGSYLSRKRDDSC